tara:strand:+ start:191 stop:430 length:240 start_codon:yes stop_codon:yes gene_type:complete
MALTGGGVKPRRAEFMGHSWSIILAKHHINNHNSASTICFSAISRGQGVASFVAELQRNWGLVSDLMADGRGISFEDFS